MDRIFALLNQQIKIKKNDPVRCQSETGQQVYSQLANSKSRKREYGFVELETLIWILLIIAVAKSGQEIEKKCYQARIKTLRDFKNEWNKLESRRH